MSIDMRYPISFLSCLSITLSVYVYFRFYSKVYLIHLLLQPTSLAKNKRSYVFPRPFLTKLPPTLFWTATGVISLQILPTFFLPCQNALIETLDHNQIEDFALLRHQTPRTKQQRIVGH